MQNKHDTIYAITYFILIQKNISPRREDVAEKDRNSPFFNKQSCANKTARKKLSKIFFNISKIAHYLQKNPTFERRETNAIQKTRQLFGDTCHPHSRPVPYGLTRRKFAFDDDNGQLFGEPSHREQIWRRIFARKTQKGLCRREGRLTQFCRLSANYVNIRLFVVLIRFSVFSVNGFWRFIAGSLMYWIVVFDSSWTFSF